MNFWLNRKFKPEIFYNLNSFKLETQRFSEYQALGQRPKAKICTIKIKRLNIIDLSNQSFYS